jgi:hypothetical protein
MGGILDWVGAVIGGIIGLPFVWLDSLFGTNIFTGIIESIMNFLGFEDEDIYSTSVIAVRVFDEDLYNKVQQDLHLEYMSKGYGSIDYANNFAKSGDSQFGRFYRTGKWDYLDYLPEGQINAVTLDRPGLEATIETLEGTDVFIIDIGNRTPPDEVWAKFQLQELYDYDVGSNAMRYTDNMWYHYASVAYVSSNNTFNVTLTTVPIINAKTYKTTTITVTSIDELTDNKNTVVTEDVLYVDAATGNTLYRTTTPVSNTNEVVDKGTASDAYVQEFVSSEDIEIPTNTITINIPNHANVQYYIVEYTRKDTGRFKYWLYNPNTNQYPIGNPNSKATNFEMFPIVMMRNAKFNINQYQASGRPASITEKRYKQTEKMLKSIGVDIDDMIEGYSDNPDIDSIQDAFFILGVSPSDNHPIVSRTLYEMFDAIYDTAPPADINTSYSMSIKENPYNAAIVWNTGDVSTYNGTIYSGAIAGDCNHVIRKFTTTTNTYLVQVVTALDSNRWNPRVSVQTYNQIETVLDGVVTNTEITNARSFTTYRSTSTDSEGNTITYTIGTTKTLSKTESSSEDGMRIQKQLTKNTYRRIDIRNFHVVSIIRGDGFSSGNDLPLDSKDLVIPLPIPVVARLTLMEKTALLGRAVHLIFYAVQHTHLEWYETEKFSKALQVAMIVIMVVVTVVVTVVTWGSGTGPTLTAFSAAMAALEAVAVAVAVQLALKLISEFVSDPALKAALSMVVMAIGVYFTMGADFGMNGLTALQLSSCCVNAAAMYMGDIAAGEMEGLNNEVESFNSKYEERNSQQQEIMKGMNGGLGAFDMVDLSTNIDMFSSTGTTNRNASASLLSPNQFFYLATNQAAYNYDLMYSGLYDNTVHNFVANRLQLGIAGA